MTNKEIRSLRLAEAKRKGTHTKEEWENLKKEFNYECVKCGRIGYHLDRDHIIPIYQGGSDAIENIQPLCAWCNSSKGPDSFNWVEYRRNRGD
jgi:5-methylcytosine-specific restriction endonuclease McrA